MRCSLPRETDPSLRFLPLIGDVIGRRREGGRDSEGRRGRDRVGREWRERRDKEAGEQTRKGEEREGRDRATGVCYEFK
jgi:hypothetical protein